MINWLVNKVALALVAWCDRNNRVYKITGGLNGNEVYLVRYIVFKSKYCCLYIHRFMKSDADDPHDHPWNFFTYVISGGYVEKFYDKEQSQLSTEKQNFSAFWTSQYVIRNPGSLRYRKSTDIHQVIVDKTRTMDELADAPFTVCLMGPRKRNWGFWPLSFLGATFIDWRSYLNISPDDVRIAGSE
jgi:hypothetical protein